MADEDDLNYTISELEDEVSNADAMVKTFNETLGKLGKQAKETEEKVDRTAESFKNLEGSMQSSVKNALDDMVMSGASFADAMRSIATSLVNDIYDAAVTPVTDSIGSAIAGMATGLLSANANGNAFSQGRVQPFANGGVVSSPTFFPMRGATGLMGEAGPEAIMPLSRGADGKLGVRTQGGSARPVNITMNVTTPDVQGFQRSQSQVAAQLSRALNRSSRNQ